ncbi:hypothetical protein SAY87_019460 [Trapa incisa]|uniref:Uncharacterized protein n=1 Tax=Trapa incisa TaxID=236973 RepID=A0AAN7K4I4_9MYRT|nr:hypothetical protein SAY87_019460 [Trapa incisa]
MAAEGRKRSAITSSPPEKRQRLEDDDVKLEELASRGLSTGGFSTPKSPKHRIPEMETCPPAPKRQRGGGGCNPDRFLSKRRIVFFTPPEIEVFFLLAAPSQGN